MSIEAVIAERTTQMFVGGYHLSTSTAPANDVAGSFDVRMYDRPRFGFSNSHSKRQRLCEGQPPRR